MLHKPRNFLPIVSMTITDGEEMTMSQIQHVRIGQVCILVYFVGVVRCNSSLRRKGELSHHVVDSIFGCLSSFG